MKESEEAGELAERTEPRLGAIFMRARDALLVLEPGGGTIVDVNDAACELFGRSRDALIGEHRSALFPPESAVVYEAAFDDHLTRSNAIPLPVALERSDGVCVRGEMSAAVVDDEGLVVLQVVFRGIAERVKETEDRVERVARTREHQKLEAVAQLAGGVAHEINNVLAGILTTGTLLTQSLPAGVSHRDAVAIVEAVRRGKTLTQNLLGFAQRGMYRKDIVPANRVLTEVATLLRKTFPREIRLATDLRSERAFKGDPGQLVDAVMNGCLNALEAMSGRGRLTLSTSDVALSAEDLVGLSDVSPGQFVRITIEDSGPGMDPETLRRAFDPFFTTKALGESAGLGLSMVYGVVRHHHGRVLLESEPGAGTRLIIDLPEAFEPVSAVPPATLARVADRDGAVLIVDDDDWVRFSSRRLIEGMRRKVLEAVDGVEGLAVYRKHADEIAFVLLDLRMPRMDGAEALRELVRIDPDVRVILCTGFDREQISQSLFTLGKVGFLRKPFELAELLQQMEEVWPAGGPE